MQQIIAKEKILDNVSSMGNVLERLLQEQILPMPLVGNVRGRGLFWSIEFMLNGERRIPMPQEAKFGASIVQKSLELGLNILGNLGDTGVVYVDHVIISPPYVVTEHELQEIVGILKEAITIGTRELFGDLSVLSPSAKTLPN